MGCRIVVYVSCMDCFLGLGCLFLKQNVQENAASNMEALHDGALHG